jgi:hypothetical protein
MADTLSDSAGRTQKGSTGRIGREWRAGESGCVGRLSQIRVESEMAVRDVKLEAAVDNNELDPQTDRL